jgi:SLT domain-containing protein
LAIEKTVASPERRGLMRLVRSTFRRFAAEVPVLSDWIKAPSLDAEQKDHLHAAAADLEGRLDSDEGRSILSKLDAAVDARLT